MADLTFRRASDLTPGRSCGQGFGSPGAATLITAKGLSKTFGSTRAVEDVSFSLAQGESVGFLGRNGAGKTTTMRMLVGYLAPTRGSVAVAGHDLMEAPDAAKALIGYLPEAPPVYPEMLVVSYLRFCGRLRGVEGGELETRIEEVLRLCGLKEVAGRVIGHLSRGYRQRVGVAQALVHDPDVLVLDEPTASLDPGQIHELRQLLRHLVSEERPATAGRPGRRTIILSTHRLEDVEATCERVLVISRGRLVADAPLAEATRGRTLEQWFLALTAGELPAAAGKAS